MCSHVASVHLMETKRQVKYFHRKSFVLALAASVLSLSGCGGTAAPEKQAASQPVAGPVRLKGAGSTFAYLAYEKWFAEFKKRGQNAEVVYQPTGSADGIKQLEAGTVDFAGTEVPLTDEEVARFKVKPMHIPALMGAIVPIYNVTGVDTELKFTAKALAGIFSGKIKKWNDPELVKANSGATLPAESIVVVHRTDGSGTTYALTDFLSRTNADWKKNFGKSATVKWTVGTGEKSSAELAAKVKQTPNSIGYVELNNAILAKVAHGSVQNSAGKFQKADLESMGAAAEAAGHMETDPRVSIANAPAKNAYPICTFNWLLVPSEMEDADKRTAMRHLMQYVIHEGQKVVMEMDYGILPEGVAPALQDMVDKYK